MENKCKKCGEEVNCQISLVKKPGYIYTLQYIEPMPSEYCWDCIVEYRLKKENRKQEIEKQKQAICAECKRLGYKYKMKELWSYSAYFHPECWKLFIKDGD